MPRRRSLRAGRLGPLVALALGSLLAVGGAARAAPAAQVSASAFAVPPGGGWTEILLILQTTSHPWRGIVEVAGGSAKLHVRLSLPENGQRVAVVPFWMEPGRRATRLWVDGVPAGEVRTPAQGKRDARILVALAEGGEASPETRGEGAAALHSALARLPESWRGYQPFALAILPPGADAALRPAQAAALQRWVRWGGALAFRGADRSRGPVVRPVGDGVAIAAETEAEIRVAFDGWRGLRGSAPSVPAASLAAWDRAGMSGVRGARGITTGRPGAPLGGVAVGYTALLLAVALAGRWLPRLRRQSLPVVVFLTVTAGLLTWGIARAGGHRPLDVREVGLVLAQPEGQGAHLSVVVQLRAERSGTSRFVPLVQTPLLVEAESPRARPNPHRAAAWDPDGAFWVRGWALGESTILRVEGAVPDLGIRARAEAGTPAWEVENRGPHTLRRPVLMAGDGVFRILPDIPPATRARLAADAEGARPAGRADPALAFWMPLLPGVDGAEGGSPILLAALDPPLPSLRFMDAGVSAAAESHLLFPLPQGRTRQGARKDRPHD